MGARVPPRGDRRTESGRRRPRGRLTSGAPATPALTPDEIRRRAARARIAYLATIGRTGRPDLVPITFAMEDDTIYSAIDHKPKRTRNVARLRNVEQDPRVTVLVDHYDENWSKLWWCRLRGDASVVQEGAAFGAGVEALTAKYEPYQRTRLRGPLIVVAITEWLGWSA